MKQNNKQVLKMIAEGCFDSLDEFYKRYDEIPDDEAITTLGGICTAT